MRLGISRENTRRDSLKVENDMLHLLGRMLRFGAVGTYVCTTLACYLVQVSYGLVLMIDLPWRAAAG